MASDLLTYSLSSLDASLLDQVHKKGFAEFIKGADDPTVWEYAKLYPIWHDLKRGFEPAIRIKETMRMSIKHPLRKLSNENWKRYGKMRYRVEQLFGSIKQKIGSSFKLLREDLARKASIACAILWNFWVLATYLFLLYFCLVSCTMDAKCYGRFLEQPP